MTEQQRLAFRDQLRDARATAQKDAEGFETVFLWLERVGVWLTRQHLGLHRLQPHFVKLAKRSPLAFDVPAEFPNQHLDFNAVYVQINNGRNDAAHEGAYARHLTDQVVQLAIVLQDALEVGFVKAQQFMVRNPVCAYTWEPLSHIRQKFLTNSFSILPVQDETTAEWFLVSDVSIAAYLRSIDTSTEEGVAERKRRLATPLEEVVRRGHVELLTPRTCGPEELVHSLAQTLNDRPVLVLGRESPARLLGIVTAFDLL